MKKIICALALAAVACGESGRGPSEFPAVGGLYIGTISSDDQPPDIFYPPTRVTVRQSGSSVTITGVVDGIGNFEASGTLGRDGAFTGTGGGVAAPYASAVFTACGEASTTRLTVRFATLKAEWDEAANTENCGTLRYAGTLER